ncbi:beta-1,4-mannosyl-glycoprotein 4-beta-N-acetylglucosaminyltransferase-like [Limulus polyphemus]|uniref:Beta-1,4-mannosyl-glycoprotein 4-beta-N-acetylglucosaminyltransferase-like n=1 Tax=Limulus polyphemus TaxID=6850 RepID=A0ABM1BAD5_LIMPO|nr:beta-1,4-mannosyl-glycoprotein 4-beta-N-acetylglucosaminyltransferase-like [Limulus polyphemus]
MLTQRKLGISNQNCCYYFTKGSMKKMLFLLALLQGVLVWYLYRGEKVISSSVFSDREPTRPVREYAFQGFHQSGLFHIPLTYQEDMNSFYAEVAKDVWCFVRGLDLASSQKQHSCICLTGWYGLDCGLPQAVWSSEFLMNGNKPGVWIKRRGRPRRLINGVVFTMDFDLLEIRINELNNSVDAFLVAEQNCSTTRDETSLPLLSKLQQGFLKEFQHKIIYVSIGDISLQKFEAVEDHEWEHTAQVDMWRNGIQMLTDFRPDDMFVFSKMSDIPSGDVLLFFKLYDGFSEPVGFHLRSVMYNFALKEPLSSYNNNSNNIMLIACSFAFFSSLCDYNVNDLQESTWKQSQHLAKFESNFGKVNYWKVGSLKAPAGWSCRWCLRPLDLGKALADQKCPNKPIGVHVANSLLKDNNSLALEMFIKRGMSLDMSFVGHRVFQPENGHHYAPSYILLNKKKFDFLLGECYGSDTLRNETLNKS